MLIVHHPNGYMPAQRSGRPKLHPAVHQVYGTWEKCVVLGVRGGPAAVFVKSELRFGWRNK